MYGRPIPSGLTCQEDLHDLDKLKFATHIGEVAKALKTLGDQQLPSPSGLIFHLVQSGDWTYLKTWRGRRPPNQQEPKWKGRE